MSLRDRLDLNRPQSRQLQASPPTQPIWERIDLTRPVKPKCKVCRHRIQTRWRICPYCGWLLQNFDQRHCVWVQCNLDVEEEDRGIWQEILADAFAKVFSAFRSINVFLTTETPDSQQWQEDFTQVYVLVDDSAVDYLGIASFSPRKVTKVAAVRIDQICTASYCADLSINQLSNLIANTVAHEIAHTLGLDHSDLNTDVMHDGLDHRIHSLMPPSFHGEQIALMNYAISRYKTKQE